MTIAIHHIPGSFSDRWIAYCKKNGIQYKLVNCYATDIIAQLSDCDALMWHFFQSDYRDVLFAKQLLIAVEHIGKKTFPDHRTCWHFDDKVGQKYLFEAIGAPLVPSYVFYSKKTALDWVRSSSFPKVFKLRVGAASQNVKLIRSRTQARRVVRRAFGKGFPQLDRFGNLKERIRKYHERKDSILGVCKGIGRLFIPTEFARMHANEKGYVYFQDFIPNNEFDIRIVVIGDRALGIKRLIRKNDFRASGSGHLLYGKEHIPLETIRIAFEIAEKMGSQCAAFDFVYDSGGAPMVLEVSYGFVPRPYDPCEGYWDKSLVFHEGRFTPQDWMVEAVMK